MYLLKAEFGDAGPLPPLNICEYCPTLVTPFVNDESAGRHALWLPQIPCDEKHRLRLTLVVAKCAFKTAKSFYLASLPFISVSKLAFAAIGDMTSQVSRIPSTTTV